MASLTPLSKGLIGLAVVGAVVSAAWHLALKDLVSGKPVPQSSTSITVTPPQSGAAAQLAPPPAVSVPVTPAASEPAASAPPLVAAAPARPQETPPAASAPKASANGHLSPAESAEMGRKYLDSGNYAQARAYLEQAVQGGDGAAACHLGEMTLKGQGGIPADQEKAAKLFQIAISKNIICFASGK